MDILAAVCHAELLRVQEHAALAMRVDAVHRACGRDREWLTSRAPRNFWNQPLPRRRAESST